MKTSAPLTAEIQSLLRQRILDSGNDAAIQGFLAHEALIRKLYEGQSALQELASDGLKYFLKTFKIKRKCE